MALTNLSTKTAASHNHKRDNGNERYVRKCNERDEKQGVRLQRDGNDIGDFCYKCGDASLSMHDFPIC